MYRLALLIFFAVPAIVHADDSQYRVYFKYPDVQITSNIIEDPSKIQNVTITHQMAEFPFECHSIPKTSAEVPTFTGICVTGMHPDGIIAIWHFIQKTETGDLYLFTIEKKKKLLKEIPILYTGKSLPVYESEGAIIKMAPADKTK